jgi:hypothetical protein
MEWEELSDVPVWRDWRDCIDGAKTGRETSVLRFGRGCERLTERPSDRIENLVRKGTHFNGHGDYPSGTCTLNPPGIAHTLSSEEAREAHVQKDAVSPSFMRAIRFDRGRSVQTAADMAVDSSRQGNETQTVDGRYQAGLCALRYLPANPGASIASYFDKRQAR